jgi:hypothetical protein
LPQKSDVGHNKHGHPSAKLVRTNLLRRHRTGPDDARVLDIVRLLPAKPAQANRILVGVSDEAGCVYRAVYLFSTFELLGFTARMHAAGFKLHPGGRGGLNRMYERVFFKGSLPLSRSRNFQWPLV